MIHLGNAPCSWGTLEFAGLDGERIGYTQMLDELRAAGYTGTDLGDWGFMPTDPAALTAALASRELALISAFVPVALADRTAHAAGVELALRTARLMAAAVPAQDMPPCIVLADANGTVPARTTDAGRISTGQGLDAAQWQIFAAGAEEIARVVLAETGLHTLFHHHCAGYIETPAEIDELLARTDPQLLGLVFDTGHFAYGDTHGSIAISAALTRFSDRIGLVHLKDCHAAIAAEARATNHDYFTAVARGVFCELGQGSVDFPTVLHWMQSSGYTGWVVVEQDVLPGMGAPAASATRNRTYLRSIGL